MITEGTLKKVPQTFTKKGFTYTLVKREGDIAIYKQRWKSGTTERYETVKIGRHNGYTMGGSYIEPSETYPGSSLWGISGWTSCTLQEAESRFNKLVDRTEESVTISV